MSIQTDRRSKSQSRRFRIPKRPLWHAENAQAGHVANNSETVVSECRIGRFGKVKQQFKQAYLTRVFLAQEFIMVEYTLPSQ